MTTEKHLVVIGAGLVGHRIAQLLAAEDGFSVTVADLNESRLTKLAGVPKLRTMQIDVLDQKQINEAVRDAEVVVTAVPGVIGTRTVCAVVEAGKPVVDISFSPEDPWDIDGLAKSRGVPVVVDCGVAPGISNFCVGHAASLMGEIERVVILVGGLPVVRRKPFEYVAVFAPSDVIEEYVRPARFVENGQMVLRPALSDIEFHDFEGIGTLESFLTDGLRTLMRTISAPNMKEKTLRYPGHAAMMQMFRDTGFFAAETIDVRDPSGHHTQRVRPVDVTRTLFERAWQMRSGEREFTALRVEVVGSSAATNVRQAHAFNLVDLTTDGETSMARTTATPAALLAARIARGDYPANAPGLHVPEDLGRHTDTFQYLMLGLHAHGIKIGHTVQQGTATSTAASL